MDPKQLIPMLDRQLALQNSRLAHHTATMAFVSNIMNYIPLGCLSIEDFSSTPECPSSWQDVTMPLVLVSDAEIASDISKLLAAGWIRVRYSRSSLDRRFLILRLYLLPEDVGLRYIDRRNAKLSLALERLVLEVDTSPETWRGHYKPGQESKFDMYATADEHSLFYMFNRIPSPAPDAQVVQDSYAREAVEDLLDPDATVSGLKTELYPYQRRSAALMLQREAVSKLELDPRLERRRGPDGTEFYYGPRDVQFLRDPRYFEAPRGGVLAETMGLGKTVICLSLILATKHHPPKIPIDFATPVPASRHKVASLMELAVAAVHKFSIPWKVENDRLYQATGNRLSRTCTQKLEQTPAQYEVPNLPARWNRATKLPPPHLVTMASTTIIVVPRNLCRQWESEIAKHVEHCALGILVMDDPKKPLPGPAELRAYDVILFSRPRFDMESKHGLDDQGRAANSRECRCAYVGASRQRDCHCVHEESLYDSPLKYLHFKRLIIDEGHFFGHMSSNTNSVNVANKLVTSDHRWVISGTPARDLLGVEMGVMASDVTHLAESRGQMLEQRRSFSDEDRRRRGAIESLGLLASNFLKIEPWSGSSRGERAAVWREHIYSGPRRTPSAYSICLRRTLESMVVKTRPEDVERDIVLPPLHHKVVRLVPSFYDKLTANLFTLVLTANAVTSERTDADYLFHKNSQKARYQLVNNLRQSAFFWTGFSEADVQASIKNSTGYLAKEGAACSDADRVLLTDTLKCTDTVLASRGWLSMSRSHELGLFVEGWPEQTAQHWAFDGSTKPLMTGISQLLEAQNFVNARLHTADPGEGLSGLGIRSLAPTRCVVEPECPGESRAKTGKPIMSKPGVPVSSLSGEPHLRNKARLSPSKPTQPASQGKARKRKVTPSPASEHALRDSSAASDCQSQALAQGLESGFAHARIVGTTSAKMSYLISQILKYCQAEKILVFYQGDNIAYYIAQVLDLLHVRHEIYARSLSAEKQSEYVVRFNQEVQDRVLLMDVNQAALGLNLCSASRIYFVNPVCRPNIEAQAIKRAHRIGQAREVFVETLVLRDTIEEQMLERSKRMTRSEHLDAKALEDDGGIRDIIQNARRIAIDASEQTAPGQMAPLEQSQQLWARPGWRNAEGTGRNSKRKRPSVPDELPMPRVADALPARTPKQMQMMSQQSSLPSPGLMGPLSERFSAGDADAETLTKHWLGSASTVGMSAPLGLRSFQNPTLPLMGISHDAIAAGRLSG